MRCNRLLRGAAALTGVAVVGWVWDVALMRLARAGLVGPRVRTIALDAMGARGLCLEAGSGDPVVLLASTLVRARSYLPLLLALAPRYRAVVVEMPGCGGGTRLAEPWSVREYASWVEAALERLGVEGATLVGHSCSGRVAVLFGQHPRVKALVLADSVGVRERGGVLRLVGARILDGLHEPALNVRVWWHPVHNLLVHPKSFFSEVHEAGDYDMREDAARVRVPTVLAWGRRDSTFPLQDAQRLLREFPNASLSVGPGSHDWLITHSSAFVDQVFVRALPAMHGARP